MKKTDKSGKEQKSNLGLSKGLYAAGNSYKDGLIWGLVATVVSFAALALGREKYPNTIGEVAGKLERAHARIKGGFAEWVEKIGRKVGALSKEGADASGKPKHDYAAALATSGIVGALVGHTVQVPSGVSGYKQAQQAVDRFDAMERERDQLIQNNADLIAQNKQFQDQLEKKSDSYTDRAAQEAQTQPAGTSR